MEHKTLFTASVLLIAYLCIGAVIFMVTEQDKEKELRSEYNKIKDVLQDHYIFNVTIINQSSMTFQDAFNIYGQVSRYGFVRGKPGNVDFEEVPIVWDYAGAFSYCVIVLTTIGYGRLAPLTNLGRCLTVLYSILGIPLTILVLKGSGDVLCKLLTKIITWTLKKTKNSRIHKAMEWTLLIVVGMVFTVLVPSAIFSSSENWTYLESMYFCFITLSTIGFGDYVLSDMASYRPLAYIWIFLGLTYISIMISRISEVLRDRTEKAGKQIFRVKSIVLRRKRKDPVDLTNKMCKSCRNTILQYVDTLEMDKLDKDDDQQCDGDESFEIDVEKNEI